MAQSPKTPAPLARETAQWLEQAIGLHRAGNYAAAEKLYEQILAVASSNVDVLRLTATLHCQRGQYAKGLRLFDKALRLMPQSALLHSSRGLALKNLNRFDEALAAIDRALDLQPDLVEALNNKAIVLQSLGRADEALAVCEQVLAIKPDYMAALNNRGNILRDLRRLDAAIDSYGRALAAEPKNADILNNRGVALQRLHRINEALDDLQTAQASRSSDPQILNNLGAALRLAGRANEALRCYDQALALNPHSAEALNNRANLLFESKLFDDALRDYTAAQRLGAAIDYLPGSKLLTKQHLCDWRGLDNDIAEIKNGIEKGKKVARPFDLLATPLDAATQLRCARIYQTEFGQSGNSARRAPAPAPGERIRIGYFSADFYSHATSHLVAGLFERHDRARFEIFAFSFGPPLLDGMRKRIAAAVEHFIDVRDRSDEQIVQQARACALDIAVDLKGFTKQNRAALFAHGLAPIHVSYLGYPGTMGGELMDYLIADRTVIPSDMSGFFDEKLVLLPGSYQANDSDRTIANSGMTRVGAGLPEQGIVLCCFNNNYKITPDVFGVWMRLLRQEPQSVLWLLSDNAGAQANLKREAKQRGIDADRLIFAPRMELPEHLERHRLADLFLDTFHYNAHTTASDALWAGLPVLTCAGQTFASRVAASLLAAVGLPEMIAQTPEQYEALACELLRDRSKLDALRARLASTRLTSSLFDSAACARKIEAAYEAVIARHRNGVPPAEISLG